MKVFVGIPTRGRNHLLDRQLGLIRAEGLEPHYLFNDCYPPPHWNTGELSVTQPDVEYEGAETKSYNEEHLTNLWNALVAIARIHGADYFLAMGSDVMPEPGALRLLIKEAAKRPGAVVGAVVPVNPTGLANFWHLGGRRGTTDIEGEPTTVEAFAGGAVLFPIDQARFRPDPRGEFVATTASSICVVVPEAKCSNVRPNGQEWN